jgi:hypothetical protein
MPQLTRNIIMEKLSTVKQSHEARNEQKSDKPQEPRKPRFRLVRLEERIAPTTAYASNNCKA